MTLRAEDLSRSAMLVDPRLAGGLLGRELPGFSASGLNVDHCEILHTRYRTSPEDARAGKAFLSVCYRLTVHDPARGIGGAQVVHLKAYPPGKSRPKFERARRRGSAAPRFGEPVAHLPGLEAVVWSFPNDPKLPHLPEVIDPHAVKRHLPYACLPPRFRRADDIAGVRVDVVRYKPEVRCTTRYELRGEDAAEPAGMVVYGKTFAHDRAGEISRRMDGLWQQMEGRGDALRVAQPLGHTEAVRTVWQQGLPGTPLPAVAGGHVDVRLLEKAAAGLACFHRAEVSGLPARILREDLESVAAEAAELGQAFPGHVRDLGAVLATLQESACSLEPQPAGLVHGDFLLKQLVLDHDGRLGLCDFDNLTTGDPVRDLANFVVDLRFQGFDARRVDEMTAAFLQAYAAQTRPLPARRLEWQCRLHYLRSAYYFYKRRHGSPEFEEDLAHILQLARQPAIHA